MITGFLVSCCGDQFRITVYRTGAENNTLWVKRDISLGWICSETQRGSWAFLKSHNVSRIEAVTAALRRLRVDNAANEAAFGDKPLVRQ